MLYYDANTLKLNKCTALPISITHSWCMISTCQNDHSVINIVEELMYLVHDTKIGDVTDYDIYITRCPYANQKWLMNTMVSITINYS